MPEGGGPVVPTVPVAVLEAALQGRATAETIGRVLGGAVVPPLDTGASAALAESTLSAGLEEFGFGPARLSTRGAALLVHLDAPSFRLAALAESFVASVLGAAAGLAVGALAFAEGEGAWCIAVLHPGVANFLRAKGLDSVEAAVALLEKPGAA